MSVALDALDARLIAALRRCPGASTVRLAAELGIARATVQSRLAALRQRRVIVGFGPDVDASAAGYGVTAFTTLEIEQGTHRDTMKALTAIPEVLEIHTVTGPGDVLCRIVAHSNDHLHEVLQRIVATPTVQRTQTQLALTTQLSRTLADLIADRAPSTHHRRRTS